MIIPATITLGDGSKVILRDPLPRDAEALLEFVKTIDAETPYMAREPGEADDITLFRERSIIEMANGSNDMRWLIATREGEVVASAGWSLIGKRSKYRHRADVGIAVRSSCWGLGLGSTMMRVLEETAKPMGVEQFELTVAKSNQRAYLMYRKLGYEDYGMAPHALRFRDGTYEDEMRMVKFLR